MTGTSFGAACLAIAGESFDFIPAESQPVVPDPALLTYAEVWRDLTRNL